MSLPEQYKEELEALLKRADADGVDLWVEGEIEVGKFDSYVSNASLTFSSNSDTPNATVAAQLYYVDTL